MDLKSRIDFLWECDALKNVERRTSPVGLSRRENSAEHSWQVMLAALVLVRYSPVKVDLLKVLKMLAIHDVPEVDVQDTFHYHKSAKTGLVEKEEAAAKRIFGLLPAIDRDEFLKLWKEFEARETAEAKFAASVDRLTAFLMNAKNNGGTWKEYGITIDDVREKNSHIQEGAPDLWQLAQDLFLQTMGSGELEAQQV